MERCLIMRLQTSIDFVRADVDKHKLVISSTIPLKVLSSAVHNGGFTKANKIINIHVPEDNEENCDRTAEDLDKEIHDDPEKIMKRALIKLSTNPNDVVGIMTFADVRNVDVSNRRHQNITLSTFVTAGVEVAATAGELTISKPTTFKIGTVGTINIILLIDGNLTSSCMVDVLKTIIEAKTVALRELDIRSHFSGDLASGTVTDSVVVACSERGNPLKYAGTATVLGELVGESVIESLKKTLYNEQKIVAHRSLINRLDERGISLAKAINLFLETHSNTAEKFEQFNEEMQKALSDPKIVPFILAGLRFDEDVKKGLIPKGMINNSLLVNAFQIALNGCLVNKTSSKSLGDTTLSAVANLGSCVSSILVSLMNHVYSNICNNKVSD